MQFVRPDEFTEDDSPRSVSEPRINTPAVVVLLGSTAAISALELMRHMLTLKPIDRRRVALVYIDTDDTPNTLVEFRRQHNGVFQEFPLRIAVPAGISHVERVRQGKTNLLEPHTFIEGKEPQYFANGAGGIRNNGHVAACFNYQHIYDALDRALVTVARLDNTQGTKRIQEVQMNIVTFLGGGTGSGILSDIAVMGRDLLTNYQYKQRLNLFCMLPEPVRGASLTDLSWRKSNATACLLELLAYSGAAAGDPRGKYAKYMRDKVNLLTNDPIANEIYLLGHASMDDATNTARIVGLDLFQRITDASGVGFLEHSKWVDRRTLGETDDRGMPTMFGTSCPLEVRFPAEETAKAFAHVSAASLLPLLASYQPTMISTSEADKREWARTWSAVARIDANISNPETVKISFFNRSEFEDADQARLNIIWGKLQRFESETELRIKERIAVTHKKEFKRINETPQPNQNQSTAVSLLNLRIQYLQQLQQEYTFALDMLTDKEPPRVPQRPLDLEAHLTQSESIFSRLRNMGRDYAYEVFVAYNRHLKIHAEATRYRLLEQLLRELLQNIQEALNTSLEWFQSTDIDERTQELETIGLSSMAWQGRLEYAHPHQRHIFDLRTLRSSDGRNIAVERLYLWVTGGDKALKEGTPIDYNSFVTRCVDYLTRKPDTTGYRSANPSETRLEEQSAGRLADRVVDFFHNYYMEKFQDTNLFELLEKSAPPSLKGQLRAKQTANYLLDHLQHIRGLMAGLIAFEAELWEKGQSTLDTSIYLGIHWRDGFQQSILNQTLADLGPLTSRGQTPMVDAAIDPHRLQVAYGQHAISLSTVRDFYLDQNSAMEAYLIHQKKWEGAGGSALFGLMPPHSSSEAQRLVRMSNALGYKNPLYKRVIRQPFMSSVPYNASAIDEVDPEK
jgi:Tubulin like